MGVYYVFYGNSLYSSHLWTARYYRDISVVKPGICMCFQYLVTSAFDAAYKRNVMIILLQK